MFHRVLSWASRHFPVILIFAMVSSSRLFGQGPVVRQELHHDVSPALRDMAASAAPAQPLGKHDAEDLPPIPLPPGFKPATEPDAVVQTSFPPSTNKAGIAPAAPTLGLNFEGLGSGFPNFTVEVAPPDTNGAVGQTQYVQWVNLAFAVFDKSTGNLLLGPLAGNSLWQGFGGSCETNNDGDPVITYDKLANRWVFTQFAVLSPGGGGFGPFFQCVAVSTTSDATGTYNRYSFQYPDFNDYPKLGVWPDAYYVTFNLFDGTSLAFIGADACAFDRNAMLNGQAATQICFPQDASVLGLLPSDVDGIAPPPAGSPNFIVGFGVNSLNLYKFHVDFTTPANSTFSNPPTNIPVSPFTPLCPSTFNCVPQPPGDGTQLDSLGDRLMYRLAYRNFGDHESLVVSHSVVADPVNLNSGVRWYEIQAPNGTPTVAQQSTFAPDSSYRWMGSVAMDVSGDLAVGYSVSSATVFPSIAIAARAFTDPASTLQPEVSIVSGGGSQTGGLTRWGDYSAMQVDPVDDCTFWYTQEYIANTGSFNWNTRIANFKFPGCGVPDLEITKSHTGNFTQGQTGATYTLTVTNLGGKPTDGTTVTVTDTLPAGLTATAISGTNWTCTLGTLTCTRTDVLASAASYDPITVTVNVASNAAGIVTNNAAVSGGGDKNAANNSASDPTTVIQQGPDPTVTKTHSGPFIQGQTGTYTITVSNVGLSPLDGTTVSVSDTLPTGLTFNAVSGTGWTCNQASPVSCTRSDALASNASYPAITLTVNVANNAPSSVVNRVTVAGGGDTNPLNNSASDPTSVIPPPPDLTITKTHTGNFNQGQQNATYTLTVSNIGSGPTTGARVVVSDTLPTGLTPASAFGNGWVCNFPTGASVICSRADILQPSSSYPAIALSVRVDSSASASVINTATVSGGGELNTANDNASDPTTINPSPDLTITKSHTPDPFIVGQTGTYTLTVSNSGNAATSGIVSVSDFLPQGLVATGASGTGWACSSLFPTSFLNCSRSDALAAGSSYPALSVAISINSGGSTVTNTATVSGGGEFNTANDSASDIANVTAPVLAITKTHTGDFTVGVPATYTITVSNVGKVATVGAVTVNDFLPNGMTATAVSGTGWICSSLPTSFLNCSRSDSLAASASYPALNVTVNIASATSTVINTAGVSGGGDALTHNASDTANVNAPTLAITKTHTGDFTVGVPAVYTITVSNVGKIATVGAVTVNDFLPNGMTATTVSGSGWNCSSLPTTFLSCSRSDSLAVNGSYPALNVTVNISNATSSVVNTASVSGGGDSAAHNASDTANVNTPALAITKTHTGNFTVGQNVIWTISVSNTGKVATTGPVTVTDNLPFALTAVEIGGPGWNCPQLPAFNLSCTRSDSLAVGASYPRLLLTATINSVPSGGTTVSNNANVTGGGDAVTHSITDVVNVTGPSLSITKSHVGNFNIGQPGTYTITVSNKGATATIGAVTVTDFLPFQMTANTINGTGWSCLPLPSLSCTRSDALSAGSSYPSITLSVTAASSGTFFNTASVTGGGDATFHGVTDTTIVNPGAILSITKTHTSDPFIVGQPGTYTITVSNTGKMATVGTVTVQDFLPFGLTATAFNATGWSCPTSLPTSFVNCSRSDALSAGGSYPVISVTVSVNGGTPAVTNTASVSGGGDPQTHNASDLTNVNGPVLAITKSHAPDPFIVGQTGTYTITVDNKAGTGATAGTVTVQDFLPFGMTINTASGTGWGCSGTGGNFLTCTRSDALPAGNSYPALTVTVNVNSGPSVINTAQVFGGGDLNFHNASDPTNVSAPVLGITKTHTGNFTAGQTGTYTITVSNTGAVATVGTITVSDLLPSGLTVSTVTGTGWSCNGTIFVSCSRFDSLATNSSYPPITLTVTVGDTLPTIQNTASVTGGGDSQTHSATDSTNVTTSLLSITKSHTGNFTVGQTGSYTITVGNVGSIATTGTVAVTDFLPFGLAATAASGTGWGCNSFPTSFVSCTRSDSLPTGSSYTPLVITVSIAAGVSSTVTNTANVTGGGDGATHSASDQAFVSTPTLGITKSHSGNFIAGQTGTYNITVSNTSAIASAGFVNVNDFLPSGMTATNVSGTGWSCFGTNFINCSRSDSLAANSSYPAINLTVSLGPAIAATVINQATVSGGGDSANHTATDATNITFPDLAIALSHSGNFFAGEIGASYTITVSNASTVATGGGTITVADVLPVGLTATGASGTGWTCSIFNGPQTEVDCTRPAGSLPPSSSYPAIALMLNVAPGAGATVTNSATLFGIGESNFGDNTASDITKIDPLAIGPSSPTTVTVTAGSSGMFSFALSLGTNPSPGTVTFAATGLPPNSTVSFAPTSLTQTGPMTMTVNTSGNGHVARLRVMKPGVGDAPTYLALLIPVFGLLLVAGLKGNRRRWLWTGISISGLVLLLSFAGCGGGGSAAPTPTPTPFPTPTPTPSPNTPPGAYVITVTATGSNTSASTPVTLVVQ